MAIFTIQIRFAAVKMAKNWFHQNFKESNFFQFLRYDDMVWDWSNHILWSCFEHHIMSLNTIHRKPPGDFVASWKVLLLEVFFNFKTFLIPFCNLKRYIQACHRKVQNLLYKTLFSDFSYPSWLSKYLGFCFKIPPPQVFK